MPFKVWSPRSITLVIWEPNRNVESQAEGKLTQNRIPGWIAGPLKFEAHRTSWWARFVISYGMTTHCYLFFIRISMAWSEDKNHHLQSIRYPSGTPCRDCSVLSLDPPSTQQMASSSLMGFAGKAPWNWVTWKTNKSPGGLNCDGGPFLSSCPSLRSGWVLY